MTIPRASGEQNSAYGPASDGPSEQYPGGRRTFTFLSLTFSGNDMALNGLRWTALGAAALVLPAARTAPVTTRYRIDQRLTQEVDATAAGQGTQSLTFSTSSFVTVTLTDSAGGKALRVVVDSMRGDSAAPIPAEVLDSARGAVFQGFVTREGRPTRLEAAGANPSAAQIQGLVSDFYPWTRAGIKVGDSWTDTSSVTTGTAPDTVTVRRVTRYRAAANEPGKRPAVRIATEYTSEVTGSQPTPSGSAKIQGTGGGKGSYLVSSDGRYLGGEWDLNSALTLSGAFAPQPVPINLRQTTRVTTLP
jgi:hypothetical protein